MGFNLNNLALPEDQGPLVWLGRRDWMRFERRPAGYHAMWPDRSVLGRFSRADLREYGDDFFQRVAYYVLHRPPGGMDLVTRYAISRTLAGGVKLFRPRPEDCRALEHTEPNVRFEDYRQPFPGVVFEWPEEYRREKQEDGFRLPHYTLAYHLSESGSVFLDSFSCPADHLVKLASPCYAQGPGGPALVCETIEGALTVGGIQEEARHLEAGSLLLTRLAINFSLLLVGYGCREAGPADTGRREPARRRSLHRTRKQKARAALARQPVLVTFEQNVRLFEDRQAPLPGGHAEGANPEGGNPSPRPHWRRGHIRRQHHGPGNALVKTVFIRPVLVRRSAFAGEPSDTRVNYDVRAPASGVPGVAAEAG